MTKKNHQKYEQVTKIYQNLLKYFVIIFSMSGELKY